MVRPGRELSVSLGDGTFVGEPLFVPRGGAAEDDGWLLVLVYDAAVGTSHVALLNAQELERGPIARAHFEHHIPYGFHGTWVPRG